MSVPGGRALPGSEITAAASAAAFFLRGGALRRRTSDPLQRHAIIFQSIPVALNFIELTLNRNIG